MSVIETQKAMPLVSGLYCVLAHLEVLATDVGFGNLVKKSCLILDYIARFKGTVSRDRF